MTRLKYLRQRRFILETPRVVSYFINGLLTQNGGWIFIRREELHDAPFLMEFAELAPKLDDSAWRLCTATLR